MSNVNVSIASVAVIMHVDVDPPCITEQIAYFVAKR